MVVDITMRYHFAKYCIHLLESKVYLELFLIVNAVLISSLKKNNSRMGQFLFTVLRLNRMKCYVMWIMHGQCKIDC